MTTYMLQLNAVGRIEIPDHHFRLPPGMSGLALILNHIFLREETGKNEPDPEALRAALGLSELRIADSRHVSGPAENFSEYHIDTELAAAAFERFAGSLDARKAELLPLVVMHRFHRFIGEEDFHAERTRRIEAKRRHDAWWNQGEKRSYRNVPQDPGPLRAFAREAFITDADWDALAGNLRKLAGELRAMATAGAKQVLIELAIED